MSDASLPKLWNEEVAAILREAEDMGWVAPQTEAPTKASYDPVTRRITTSFSIPTVVAKEMLERGEAFIDSAGKFQLVEGEPLPPGQRTTHVMTFVVREVKP